MPIVALVSLFAGMLIGAAFVSYRFRRNWSSKMQQRAEDLEARAEEEKNLRLENKALEQKLADTEYALNEKQKELDHLKRNSPQE